MIQTDLEKVKVGDKVAIVDSGITAEIESEGFVTRLTTTQIIIDDPKQGERRWNKKANKLVGSYNTRLRLETPVFARQLVKEGERRFNRMFRKGV